MSPLLHFDHNFLYNSRPHFLVIIATSKRGDRHSMLEIAPIVNRIKDLSERVESLRRYL